MTLLAALLLERRVILVAEERDTVSAAVHAAAALLYPFRWQHIYLPLLPIALKVCPHKQACCCTVPITLWCMIPCLYFICICHE